MTARRPAAIMAPLALATLLGGCRRPADLSDAPAEPATATGPSRAEELMASAGVPGLALAVIRDGRSVQSEVFGVADRESGTAVGDDTLFEAASLSKPVFATVALRMAERGELDLDRPLLDLVEYERLSHDPRVRRLTARLVLSHQTGLPNWGGETLELETEPGEAFGYSGEGFVLLQRALEETTGKSLDALARVEVFEPLGMVRSRFSWSEGTMLELASPHDQAGRPQPVNEPREGNAAFSLRTTASEYARFVVAWLNGELLGERAAAEALRPAVQIAPMSAEKRASAEEGESATPPLAWGLGWGIQLPVRGAHEHTIYWHWGDNGPSQAFVAFDPAARSGLVYFANSANGLAIGPALVADVVGEMGPTFEWLGYERYDAPGYPERLAGAVAESEGRYGEAAAAFRMALVADLEDQETARRVDWLTELLDRQQRPIELPPTLLERYAGTYGPRVLSVEDGVLHYRRAGGTLYRLVPLSDTLFALDALVTFRIEVALDERGEPAKLIGHYLNGETDESPRDPG